MHGAEQTHHGGLCSRRAPNRAGADAKRTANRAPAHTRTYHELDYAAAYVLHHSLRTEVLVHTELARAQPSTVITKLFKIAVRVVAYQDRVKLHLPSASPFKALLHRISEILYHCRAPPRGQPA